MTVYPRAWRSPVEHVAWYLWHGYNAQRVRQALHRRFSELTEDERREIIRLGRAVVSSAESFQSADGHEVVGDYASVRFAR